MTIDRTDPRSPSRQIADDLRESIQRGALAAGAKLPSERELVDRYGVAPQTARQAVAVLKAEGLVEGARGRGVFVREPPPLLRMGSERYTQRHREHGMAPMQAEVEARGLTWRQEILALDTVEAPKWVADWFNVEPDTKVFVRRRRTWIAGRPTQLADSYYQLADVEGTAIMREDTGPGGGFARLEERGHRLTRFREEITVRMPTPEETRGLQLGPGSPVAELHRIAYDQHGVVEVFRSVLVGGSHVFAYEFDAPK